MDQGELMRLLQEAAQCGSYNDRSAIGLQVAAAVSVNLPDSGDKDVNPQDVWNQELVGHLFDEISNHRPDLLAKFLPIFAMLCGNRENGAPYAKIDWSLVN